VYEQKRAGPASRELTSAEEVASLKKDGAVIVVNAGEVRVTCPDSIFTFSLAFPFILHVNARLAGATPAFEIAPEVRVNCDLTLTRPPPLSLCFAPFLVAANENV